VECPVLVRTIRRGLDGTFPFKEVILEGFNIYTIDRVLADVCEFLYDIVSIGDLAESWGYFLYTAVNDLRTEI